MNAIDREVDRALRDGRFDPAPAEARPERILAAARAAERRARGTRKLALGLAALALGGAFAADQLYERAEERAMRRARMLDEQQELQRELDDLKALLEERSRVRLGGDEKTEFYLDLARLEGEPSGAGTKRSDG
jgi:hypothetical protein